MEALQVTEKILSDAKAEAEKIKQEAIDKQAAEQAKLDGQLTEYKKQTEALSKKAAEEEKLHLLASARMEIAKELLTEKRKILDEVFEHARGQLLSLPDEQYRRFITSLMLKAVETGEEEIILDNNEKRIDQNLIDQVNQQLAGISPATRGQGLHLADKRQEIGGGFILKRGKIRSNVSFDVLLAQARDKLEIELAKELFTE